MKRSESGKEAPVSRTNSQSTAPIRKISFSDPNKNDPISGRGLSPSRNPTSPAVNRNQGKKILKPEEKKEEKVPPAVKVEQVLVVDDEENGLEDGDLKCCTREALANTPKAYWALCFVVAAGCAVAAWWVEHKTLSRKWHLLIGYALLWCLLPIGNTATFFHGLDEKKKSGKSHAAFWLVTFASFTTWVMAKSIANAATLSATYGLTGGLGYAAYYVAVFSSGWFIYLLRGQGYFSLPDFIFDRYGPLATVVFAITILYRLYQEVWSNTIVIADFYGVSNSEEWRVAAWVSMAIPACYTILGGMRVSLLTDLIQGLLMCALLAATYYRINELITGNEALTNYLRANQASSSPWFWNPKPKVDRWSMKGGLDFLLAGLLQGFFSYPFMDAALTDRAFLADRRTMLAGFSAGAIIAAAFIVIFGFIGTYGAMISSCVAAGKCPVSDLRGANIKELSKGSVSAVGIALGDEYTWIVLVIIITSALSTLDSTFTSVSKVFGVDLYGMWLTGKPVDPREGSVREVWIGRAGIVVIGICGTLPLFYNPEVLSATTVSGTMVPGMGPPIYCAAVAGLIRSEWSGRSTGKRRPMLYLIPFFFGAALGTVYQMKTPPHHHLTNCTPSSLLACTVPNFLLTDPVLGTKGICDDYSKYYKCIRKSGCYKKKHMKSCQATNRNLGCSINAGKCWEFRATKRAFETTVDMSGFNVGNGAYKNFLGVNIVSALGALGLFLFLCSDDVLEYKLARSGGDTLGSETDKNWESRL